MAGWVFMICYRAKVSTIFIKQALLAYFMKTFTAIIHQEEEMYVAQCPEVGTVSQGNTIEEALANLKEATSLYLEEIPQTPHSHPILTTFEVVSSAKA